MDIYTSYNLQHGTNFNKRFPQANTKGENETDKYIYSKLDTRSQAEMVKSSAQSLACLIVKELDNAIRNAF